MVAVVALAMPAPAMVAAARVRLNAMTARTSQAAFAVNTPDGRCAKALFFRSALTCSMMPAMGFVGGDGGQVACGEECVEPVRVKQGRVVQVFLVQFWD